MKHETILVIVVGVLGIALFLSFLLPVYQQKKYDKAIVEDKIARANFMKTFPVEKYGYEKGAIPEFLTRQFFRPCSAPK